MKSSGLFKRFFDSEKAGGMILLIGTLVSLLISNSDLAPSYLKFWQTEMASHTLGHWINEGFMTIFFLLIGLELEREMYEGELANVKQAMLPVFAAIGGMLFPAGIYLSVNHDSGFQSGAGIPMATDIAFALGVLSLLGKSVPTAIKIFLTALAVMDDLGSVLVIAFFYTHTLNLIYLFLALLVFGMLLLCNKLGLRQLFPYLFGGLLMWYFMLHSGVHATLSGVLLAFAIPFRKRKESSPSTKLLLFLHKPVAFFILPLFALANTAITISPDIVQSLLKPYSIGIALGLILGKPIGICLFVLLAKKTGICTVPEALTTRTLVGLGFLGGIGFTMSVFITLLAFDQASMINTAKLTILIASLIAGSVGYLLVKNDMKI